MADIQADQVSASAVAKLRAVQAVRTTEHLNAFAAMIPIKDAQHVLYWRGDTVYGVDGGHFTTRLLETMSAADRENLAKLAIVFPGLGNAFALAMNERDGFEVLRDRVKAVRS